MKRDCAFLYKVLLVGAMLSFTFGIENSTQKASAATTYSFVNNYGSSDLLKVKGAIKDSVYNVYDSTGTLLQAFKSKAGDNEFKFKDQLIDNKVMTIKVAKKNEKEVQIGAFLTGIPPKNIVANPNLVTVSNNVDSADVVKVTGLPIDSKNKVTIKVINDAYTLLGTGSSDKNGVAEIKLKRNLGKGYVRVIVTSKSKTDSESIFKAIPSEEFTPDVTGETPVKIENFAGKTADVITITKLSSEYDKGIVTVYFGNGKILGSGKISAKKDGATAKVTLKAGTILYGDIIKVTLKQYNKLESDVSESPELFVGSDVSREVNPYLVKISSDRKIIEIGGLSYRDKVSIYTRNGEKALASGTADTTGKAVLKASKGFAAGYYEFKNLTKKYEVSPAVGKNL